MVAPRIAVATQVFKHRFKFAEPFLGQHGALLRCCERRCIPQGVSRQRIDARRHDVTQPTPVEVPATLRLRIEPAADCARYDGMRPDQEAGHGAG